MAARDPDLVETVTLTSWIADDGTLVDETSGYTDDDTDTGIAKIGKSPSDGLKITFNDGLENVVVGDTVSVFQTGSHQIEDWALLAYTDSNSVTTTAKIVVEAVITDIFKVFTFTQAFIDEIGDQGSGKWSCRLVPDLDDGGDGETSEVDADLSTGLVAVDAIFFGTHW